MHFLSGCSFDATTELLDVDSAVEVTANVEETEAVVDEAMVRFGLSNLAFNRIPGIPNGGADGVDVAARGAEASVEDGAFSVEDVAGVSAVAASIVDVISELTKEM